MTAPAGPKTGVPAAPLAAVVLGASAIGTAVIFVRLADDAGVGATAAAAWRMGLAVPLLLAVFAWPSQRRTTTKDGGRGWLWAGLAGLMFAGDLVTWHAGIVRTTAANATLLANLTPIPVALFGWLLLGERVGPKFLAAMAVTLAGAVLLSGAGLSADDPERLLGDALCALTALWYAAYFLAIRAARRSLSAAQAMAVSTLVGAPIVALAAWAFGSSFLPEVWTGWLWLAGLALIAHVGGQGLIAYGLGRVPTALASVAVLIQPVVAASLGYLVFKETLTPLQALGAAIVLAGVIAARLTAPTPPAQARQPQARQAAPFSPLEAASRGGAARPHGGGAPPQA